MRKMRINCLPLPIMNRSKFVFISHTLCLQKCQALYETLFFHVYTCHGLRRLVWRETPHVSFHNWSIAVVQSGILICVITLIKNIVLPIWRIYYKLSFCGKLHNITRYLFVNSPLVRIIFASLSMPRVIDLFQHVEPWRATCSSQATVWPPPTTSCQTMFRSFWSRCAIDLSR